MVVKIDNFDGKSDSFTFPNNPETFDDSIESNYTLQPFGHQRYSTITSAGGVIAKKIVFNGSFFGTSKNSNYQTLSRHFMENTKLKKFYWESNKFYLGVGKDIKKTHSGGRTNFIDYVATFEAIIGILFSDTLKVHTNGGAHQTNAGNVTTFIEEINGTITNGSANLVISDDIGTTLTLVAANFNTGDEILLRLVKTISTDGDGIFFTEFEQIGVFTDSGTTSSTSSFKLIQSGQNFVSTVNIGDIIKNTTDNTFAVVNTVDSNTQLNLDEDIMTSGETYIIYRSKYPAITGAGGGVLQVKPSTTTETITVSNLDAGYQIKLRDGYSA